jgi:hypothetical protein
MAWTPDFKVIDQRTLAENILGYLEANQTDALAWAGTGLRDFVRFYTNASGRLATEFPCLMILTQNLETDLTGDQLQGDLQLVLEGALSGSDTDQLVADAKKYAMAVESMLANIPSTTVATDANQYHKVFITELETRHDIIKTITSGFLQIFQVRVRYAVLTSGV